MHHKLIFSLLLFIISFTGCKENNPVDTNSKTYSYQGKVYFLVDSVKVPRSDIQVILNNDTTRTDSLGEFEFTSLETGKYTILFKYYKDPADPFILISKQIQIPQPEEVTEFTLTDLYTFSGKVFMIRDSVKVPQSNIDVYLNNDTTQTDALGEFTLSNLSSGQHRITFKYYDSTLDSVLLATYFIVVPQSNEFTEFILPGTVIVAGEVFSYLNDGKVYLENIKIKIGKNLAYTNYEGQFVLQAPILPGSYNVFVGEKDFYSSIDSTLNIASNSYLEFELKSFINKDIIFINNNYYYYRYKSGDIVQLTNIREDISDDLEFSDLDDYFIYTSRYFTEYHLNLIDLNSYQHKVLYSSTTKITQPTISPDGSRIYMMRGNTVGYVTLERSLFNEVFSLSDPYWQGYLFHNCEKIITAYKPDQYIEYLILIDFVRNDTTVVDTFFSPANIQEISPDDKYVSFLTGTYPSGCDIFNTQNHQWSNYGAVMSFTGWGKFFDSGNKVFGNEFEMVDSNTGNMITGGIITDFPSGNKVFIDDDDVYYWRPDFCSENNSYLYSTHNYRTGNEEAIWLFDASNNKRYNVMPSESRVWGARYVPR